MPSPIDSKVVTELVNEAIKSILKSKLYGDTGLAKLEENIVKPTELFIKSLKVINLIMVHIPDLLVAFHKRGCVSVKERELNVADCKSIERSEYGPLSYIAGYIIAKMFAKAKCLKAKPLRKQSFSCCYPQ